MKFLVIGPSWVGDMVMAQALFITLRQQHPDAVIDVLAPHWCMDLLQRMPEVRQAIQLDVGHGEFGLGKRWRLGRQLIAGSYDQAIVLPNSFKSALIPLFARIPVRTGWRGEARNILLNDCRKLDKTKYPLMVERFVALAYPVGQPLPKPLARPALKVDPTSTAALRSKLQLQDSRRVLVMCPGAEFGPSKQWPEASFAEVARHYIAAGYQIWILGSAKDRETGARVLSGLAAGQATYCKNLCGQTSLGDAIDLMAAADAVVSNDSGLMHVAAALALPLVVVYGSTSAAFTPPLADRVRALSLQLSCSPCFKRTCPLGHHNCMKQLHPNQVIGALAELSI
jgi:heptosyltransferase II